RGVTDRCEVDKVDPIREAVSQAGGRCEGQAGLADAAGAGEGDEVYGRVMQQRLDVRDLTLTADERRGWAWEVDGQGRHRGRNHGPYYSTRRLVAWVWTLWESAQTSRPRTSRTVVLQSLSG